MVNQIIAQGYIDSNLLITQGYQIAVPTVASPGGKPAVSIKREPNPFWGIVKDYLEMKTNA